MTLAALAEICEGARADAHEDDHALRAMVALLGDATGRACAIYRREEAGTDLLLGAHGGEGSPPAPRLVAPWPGAGPASAADRCRLESGALLVPACWAGRMFGALWLGVGEGGERTVSASAPLVGAHLAARSARRRAGDDATAARRLADRDAVGGARGRILGAGTEGAMREALVREAAGLMGADAALLCALRPAGDPVVVASVGWSGDRTPPAVVRLAAPAAGETVWLGREAAVRWEPVQGDDDEPHALVVVRRAGRPFGEDDLARLGALGEAVGEAFAHARLVTRLRRERGERQALAARLVNAQEEERRRVAENIHDGPVQELVGVGLLLDALARDLGAGAPDQAARAARAAGAARDALRGLRRAILDLHPIVLEELGFAAAMRGAVERLEWQGASVRLDVHAVDLLDASTRTVAFRVCQEAMANVLRHADARNVTIAARREGSRVVMEVCDDGRGFDPDNPEGRLADGHLGITTLRERAALAGGDLQVFSHKGRGTCVRVELPLGETDR